MWTGVQWGVCVIGLTFMTATLISISMFLAYAWNNKEDLSQRVLNILFTKLAVANFISAILLCVEMMWRQSGMILSVGLNVFAQIRTFIALSTILIFLELSVCSLIRLLSSQLYMWASLNIPHTAYTIVQAFMIVFMQYLCLLNSGIADAQDVTDLVNMMNSEMKTFAGPVVGLVFILHVIVISRYRIEVITIKDYIV